MTRMILTINQIVKKVVRSRKVIRTTIAIGLKTCLKKKRREKKRSRATHKKILMRVKPHSLFYGKTKRKFLSTKICKLKL
jgi:hypothetical protein